MLNKTLIVLLALLTSAVWASFSDELGQLFDRTTNVDYTKLSQLVQKKTTRQDVIELLGEPKHMQTGEYSVSYLYEYSDLLLALFFYDDVLLFQERADNDGRYKFEVVKE